jgi:ABC-type transport system involved in cytochrome c biogenesis permease component
MIGRLIGGFTGLFDGFASSAVLLREAARTSRQWQTYAARAGFSGALFGVLLLGIWTSVNAPFVDVSEMGWMGKAIFAAFSVVLLLLAIVLSPLMTSSALIEETEDRTLEMLILSKLEPSQILAAKVISRILLLITVVFGAMPVMAMVVTLGGVAPQAVVAVTVHTLVAVVVLGALGAFFGLFTRSPMLAMMAAASYTLPTFVLLPIGYVICTGNPEDAAHFSLFAGPAVEDWTAPIATLSYLPSLVLIHVIGTRLFELKVSNADIRRAFAPETWSTRAWAIALGVAVVTGATLLPAASVGTYMFRFAGSGARGLAQEAGLLVCMGGVWLWWVFALTVLTWALLRVGVDVVDAMDAILGGRGAKKRDRRDFHVWMNPVAWREARPAAWGTNGVPVIVTWLLIMLGMLQTGWWIVPGGSLAMGVMNTVAALALTLWLASRTIEEERRAGALDVLLTTTMASWRILGGKAAGVAVPTLPLLLLSLPFLALGVPHLHMFELGSGGPSPLHWLIRGVLSWVWTLPLWFFLIAVGMWTALRVRRRGGFGLAVGGLLVVLGVPMVLGRLFSEVPLIAVPCRMVVPPLAGDAEIWQYAVACVGWGFAALATSVWTSVGLRRWLAAGFAVLLAFAVGAGTAHAQGPVVERQDDFLILAEPLGDGVIRPGQWAAVRVRLANLGGNANAVVEMVEREDTQERVYGRPVDLPQGVRKDVVVLYRPNTSTRDRMVELRTDTGRRAVASFRLRPARDEDSTVAVIGTDMLGIQALRATAPGGVPGPRPRTHQADDRVIHSGLVDLAGMPSHAAGWQAFDQVVWHRADPSSLAPAQVDALVHWVADGGHLLLTVAENWQSLQDSALGPALPIRFQGTADHSDLSTAQRALGGTALATPVPMAVGEPVEAPGRSRFVRLSADDGTPLLVTNTFGLGTVTVFTADPSGSAFKGNVPTEDLWRTLLMLAPSGQSLSSSLGSGTFRFPATQPADPGSAPAVSVPWADPTAAMSAAFHQDPMPSGSVLNGIQRWSGAEWSDDTRLPWETEIRSWLADIPGVAPLPMSWLLAFSAVYLFFIGPLDWFVLRALKRQPWTWVTFPVTIVFFSTAALAGTYWMKGSQAMVSTLEVVDLLPGTGLWRGDAWVGVFATRRTRVGLASDVADSVAEPLIESGYTRETRLGAGLGPGSFTYTADTWTLGYARLSWIEAAPGGIGFEVLPAGGWAITNGLPFALTDAELHVAAEVASSGVGVYPLGALEPGQRVVIDPSVREPFGTDPTTDDEATLTWWRYRALDAPSPGRGYLDAHGVRFVLIGTADRVTDLAVDGVRPIHRQATLIRAPLTPPLDPQSRGDAFVPGLPGESP